MVLETLTYSQMSVIVECLLGRGKDQRSQQKYSTHW